ncbi:hypothetical protein BGZ68_010874 [Mortierella alpina]|nr:hypothetical protein BGZ68_010874 [Mortierella alpina]
MKVLWFQFTSVAVIAVTIALSHLNTAVATNVDNGIDYMQHHHHHYVERDLQDPQDPQDDETAAVTAMDYEHPQIPGVDTISPQMCVPLTDSFVKFLNTGFNTSLDLLHPLKVQGSPLYGCIEGAAKGIAKQSNDTGAMAALTVTAVNITFIILREYQDVLSTAYDVPSVVFDAVYGVLQTINSLASAVVTCTGATTNCKAVSSVFGYVILAGLPAVERKSRLSDEVVPLVRELLKPIAKAAQGLIDNKEGSLKVILDDVKMLARMKRKLNFPYQVAFDVVDLFSQASC